MTISFLPITNLHTTPVHELEKLCILCKRVCSNALLRSVFNTTVLRNSNCHTAGVYPEWSHTIQLDQHYNHPAHPPHKDGWSYQECIISVKIISIQPNKVFFRLIVILNQKNLLNLLIFTSSFLPWVHSCFLLSCVPGYLSCCFSTPVSVYFSYTCLDPRLFWPVDRLQYGPSHLLFLPASIPGCSGLWIDYSTAHLIYFSYPPRYPALLACGSTTVQPISLTFPTRLDPRLVWPVGRLQYSPSHLLFLPASIPGSSGLWVDYRTAHLTYFSYPPRSPALLACGSTTEQPISLTFPTRLDPWLFWPVGRLQNSPSHLLFLPASIPGCSGLWVDYRTAHLLLFLPASIPGSSSLWVDNRTAHLTYFSYPPRSLAVLACGATTEQPISYFSYPPRSPAVLACGSTTVQPISEKAPRVLIRVCNS